MESNDLDDLFEESKNEKDEEAAEATGSNSEVIKAPKKVTRHPRLTLNPERLCGKRGIPILVDHFQNVKFKGAGHEVEDLDKLMSKLEHWTHRLFPSMKFEQCLHHIEKLGRKRPVQTCLRKIRLDMPILDSDFTTKDGDIERVGDPEPSVEMGDPEPSVEDAFDSLLDNSHTMERNDYSLNDIEAISGDIEEPSSINNETSGRMLGTSLGLTLTDEQKERMERNRLLAAERRKAKLDALKSNEFASEVIKLKSGSALDIEKCESFPDERKEIDTFSNDSSVMTINNKSADLFGETISELDFGQENLEQETSHNTISEKCNAVEDQTSFDFNHLLVSSVDADSSKTNDIEIHNKDSAIVINAGGECLELDDLMNLVNEEPCS